MSDLTIFKNEEFGEIRTILIDDALWFCLKDVCDILEITNITKLKERLNKEGLTQSKVLTNGGIQMIYFINEPNLYKAIFRSDKPEAKKFENWVTNEILPFIRKHGSYMTPKTIEETLTDPDFIISLATKLKEEQIQRRLLENKIENDKPKVRFADSIKASNDSILIRELAKLITQNGYRIGGNQLFKWMRINGYLIKNGGTDYNIPTQKAMNLKLFNIKETLIKHNSGTITVSITPMVTGKGQIYFVNKFLN